MATLKPITPAVIRAVRNSLKESYPGLTLETVKADIDRLVAGEPPKGIIGMFAQGMLRDAGYLALESG